MADGEIVIWPNAVLDFRQQNGIGVLRVPNGYSASGGVVDFGGDHAKAVVWGEFNWTVRVRGTDVDDNVITEDLVGVSTGHSVMVTGVLDFYSITGVTVIASDHTGDGFYTAGYRWQTVESTSGFNIVKNRGSLGIRRSNTVGDVQLRGSFDLETLGLPATLPDASHITFMRFANNNTKSFVVNGTETVVLPSSGAFKGQEVKSVGTYSELDSLTINSSAGAVFYDIGIEYREFAFSLNPQVNHTVIPSDDELPITLLFTSRIGGINETLILDECEKGVAVPRTPLPIVPPSGRVK